MTDPVHAFVTELLAAQAGAAACACGFDPRLLEWLIDRHGAAAGPARVIGRGGPAPDLPGGRGEGDRHIRRELVDARC